jgi:hypothetical protein
MNYDQTAERSEQWAHLLEMALSEPGVMLAAYRAFHRFSVLNQLMAYEQCSRRRLPPGPLATFADWLAKGRPVQKGQKALSLVMPVPRTRTETAEDGTETRVTYQRFIVAPRWFVHAQTAGEDVQPEPVPDWDGAAALAALHVAEIPFDLLNGGIQGFSRPDARQIAISPVAALPIKTTFHELGHVLLHAASEYVDADSPDLSEPEVEAEAVAYLCLAALELPGAEYCRGYIQRWNGPGGRGITGESARRIMTAANQILTAGRTEAPP